MSPTTLLVVRHAEAEGNVARRLSAAIPGEPLTVRGQAQASALAQRLDGRDVAAIYASPLLRAQQTAAVLSDGLSSPVSTVDGLREFSMGRFEGSRRDEDIAHIDTIFLRWLDGDLDARVDGGENGHDVLARMTRALSHIAAQHPGETVVVVSHGGAMCLALPLIAGVIADDHTRSPFPNCGLAEMRVNGADWRIAIWPGDPDRAPHPGDLVDLLGRAGAAWSQVAAAGRARAAAVLHGVPCHAFDIEEPWAAQATFTGEPDLPDSEAIAEITAWLAAHGRHGWQLRVRAEQADAPVFAALRAKTTLGVWATESRPHFTVPSGVEIGPAHNPAEFLAVAGAELAPLVTGDIAHPGRTLLVLREQGRPVACARVTEAAGTGYVSAIEVHAERRRHGLGTLISAAATDFALRQAGLAWVHCVDDVAGLYAGLGYRRLTTHVDLQP